MDLLCISPFIRGGPPFGTAPTQAPVGAFLRAEGYAKRCCQFESVAAQRHRRGATWGARYALRVSRSVVVSLSLSRRNAASESEPVMYGVYITFQAGRPLGRPLRCGHKAAKTSHEPLTTNNKKSTSGCPTSPAESRVSLSDRILSLHQVTRFGISDSHGFARRRAPSKPVPCLSQGTLVG